MFVLKVRATKAATKRMGLELEVLYSENEEEEVKSDPRACKIRPCISGNWNHVAVLF